MFNNSSFRQYKERNKGLCNNYLEGGGSKINGGGGGGLKLKPKAQGRGGGVRCNFLNICRGGGGLEVKLRGLISIHGLKINVHYM